MANSFFDWAVSLTRFVKKDVARAEEVNAALDNVSLGFESVEALTTAAIKLPPGESSAALPAAATRKGKVLTFNSSTGAAETTVAMGDVTAVAAIVLDVSTVAANAVSVSTAATNIAAIIAAPSAASTATTQAGNASTSAGNALTSENNASASASAAGISATNAHNSELAAAASAASINLPSMTGNALKVLRANAGETAIEYAAISTTPFDSPEYWMGL